MIRAVEDSGDDADNESVRHDGAWQKTNKRTRMVSRTSKKKQNKKVKLSEEDPETVESVRNEVSVADWAWDVEKERRMKEIATRGAVRLFNAVNKQQKATETKLRESNTEAKRARVVKSIDQRSFVDILKESRAVTLPTSGTKRLTSNEKDNEQPTWTVLRDNFMMTAKMRDWDKDHSDSSNEEM
jgi:ribosome-binding ATPase YchF (GTP1/OBG family)